MRKGKRSSRKGSVRGMGCCWAEKRARRQGLLYLAHQRQEPRRRIWLQTQIGQTTPWTLLSWYPPFREGVSGEPAATSFCQTVSPLRPSVSKSVAVTRSTASRLHPAIWPTVVRSLPLYAPTYTYVYPQPQLFIHPYKHIHTYLHAYIYTGFKLWCSTDEDSEASFQRTSLIASSTVFGSTYKLFLEQKNWSTN